MGAGEARGGVRRVVQRIAGREPANAPAPRDEPAFAAVTGTVVPIPLEGLQRPARPVDDARLELISRANLDLVVASAEDAGIEYFLLPDRKAHVQHAIAIVDTDALAFSTALRARAAGDPVYVLAQGTASWIGSRRPDEGGSDDLFGDTPILRVAELRAGGTHRMRLGLSYGAHVELWHREDDGTLVAPRRNPLARRIEPDLQTPATARVAVSSGAVSPGAEDDAREYRTLTPFTWRRMDDVDFDIDVVYTWVDGSDPAWVERKNARDATFDATALNPLAANPSRYMNRDELRYSLRSIEMFAPWVRRIFLVTDQQRPDWLLDAHPRLKVVDHRDIFGDDAALPTFNSHAIESRLHHIDGLAEHYLYFNDDVMLGRAVRPEDFFHSNGTWKYFMSDGAQVDLGAPGVDGKPITAAAKNNRAIIEELFGRTLVAKMKHAPHAARRSVLLELEERLPAWFEATAHHPFRHPGDVSVATSLGHYYAYCTGRAVPADLRYDYADIAVHPVAEKFAAWKAGRDLDVFCINDTATTDEQYEEFGPVVTDFLERYFPLRSTFEK